MKFPGYVGYGVRNNRANCGGDIFEALNPLKTGLICLFSGSVFFNIREYMYRLDGYSEYEHKRNWLGWFTPDYIASRSQTRCGAGLRSRGTSC